MNKMQNARLAIMAMLVLLCTLIMIGLAATVLIEESSMVPATHDTVFGYKEALTERNGWMSYRMSPETIKTMRDDMRGDDGYGPSLMECNAALKSANGDIAVAKRALEKYMRDPRVALIELYARFELTR